MHVAAEPIRISLTIQLPYHPNQLALGCAHQMWATVNQKPTCRKTWHRVTINSAHSTQYTCPHKPTSHIASYSHYNLSTPLQTHIGQDNK